MDTRNVDVAIIGAGTAGLNARREVEKAGKSYVLIESGHYGTTCARVGCMPSKLLIAAAEAAHGAAHAERFGVRVAKDAIEIDGPAVMERVRRERDRFVGFVVRGTEAIPAEHRIRGHARFVGPTELVVDEAVRVRAKAVVVASGSRPVIPGPFAHLSDHVDVNDTVFEWSDLPTSVAVVGTGVIGLELGQALHRLGVRVEFFNPFEVLGAFTDPEVVRVTREVLSHELTLHLGISDLAAERREGRFHLRWSTDGASREATFDRVIVAAGRRPNLDNLDFDKAEVPTDERGRPKWNDLTSQCSDTPIFLAGDVSGHRPLLHEAADEGNIAGANAARYPHVIAHSRRLPLAIAFTSPQMALVGATYRELEKTRVEIGSIDYGDQGRARVMGENAGLVRIYAEHRNCRLVGAEMFGPRVEHTAHLLAWAIQRGMTVQECLAMPFYHPVIEEGIRTALRDLAERLTIAGGCRGEDMPDCPGT